MTQITGTVVIGPFGSFGLPSATVIQLGADGEFYVVGQTSEVIAGAAIRIGRPSDGQVANLTHATMQADLAGSPLTAPAGMTFVGYVPAVNTPYFYILFFKVDVPCHFAAVMYKINSIASIVPVGGVYLLCATPSATETGQNVPNTRGCLGANVLDLDGSGDKLYGFFDAGFGNPSNTLETWIYRLPLNEAYLSDATPGSLNAIGCRLSIHGSGHPLSWHSVLEPVAAERSYGDKVSLIKADDQIGIFRYVGRGATPSLHYAEVTIGANLGTTNLDPVFTGSYITDKSTEFGIPFSDTGLKLDGSAPIDPGTINDYVAPSPLSEIEVAFGRGDFEGNQHILRERRFIKSGGIWVGQPVVDFTQNNEFFTTDIEGAQAIRVGGDLSWGIRDAFRWIFGGHAVEPPPEEPPGGGGDEETQRAIRAGRHGGPFPSAEFMPPLGRWTQYAVIVHLEGLEIRPSKAFPRQTKAKDYVAKVLEDGLHYREEFFPPSDILHIWLADEDGNMNQVYP